MFFRMKTICLILFIITAIFFTACQVPSQPDDFPTPPIPDSSTQPQEMLLGVNGLNGPEECATKSNQCNNNRDARELGITWDRWPAQWYYVEQPGNNGRQRGDFQWQGEFHGVSFDMEKAANADNTASAKVNALVVLNGIVRTYDCIWSTSEYYLPPNPDGSLEPEHFDQKTECDIDTENNQPRIMGLFETVSEPNGSINESNRWGNYVYQTISTLSPGVKYYQTFNEPNDQWIRYEENGIKLRRDPNFENINDVENYFIDDYVQMVKVTLDAANKVSNNVHIVLGSPHSPFTKELPELNEKLQGGSERIRRDKWATQALKELGENNDIVQRLEAAGIHSYAWPFRTPVFAQRFDETLFAGTKRPLWVTESGAKVGRDVDNESEQASYALQHFAYARIADIAINFHFRMYEDADEKGFGLYDSIGIPRESIEALNLAKEFLADAILINTDSQLPKDGQGQLSFTRQAYFDFIENFDYTKLVFESPQGDKRITVLWANKTNISPKVPIIPWSNDGCTIVYNQDGTTEELPENHTIELAPAPGEMIGGSVKLLVETNEPCEGSLQGDISLSCDGSSVNYVAWDDSSNLKSLDVTCGDFPAPGPELPPLVELFVDLLNYIKNAFGSPGASDSPIMLAGTTNIEGSEGQQCTATLANEAGDTIVKTFQYTGPSQCKGGGNPGGDHPDENESAASPLILADDHFILPAGARADFRTAILQRGFAEDLWRIVLELGEPATFVDVDFDPVATVEQYPVLLIPSGGLYGSENSLLLKTRLERYAEAGGTIMAFAQQRGYEYSALPVPSNVEGPGVAPALSPTSPHGSLLSTCVLYQLQL